MKAIGYRRTNKEPITYNSFITRRLLQMKTIEVVAGAIVHDGKVLATQRGYGPWSGWWEFPGGKMEHGESREEALRRELLEELAMEVEVREHIDDVEYDYADFHLLMHLYRCLPLSAPTLLEHSAARWLTAAELHTVQWLPADEAVLEQIKKIL